MAIKQNGGENAASQPKIDGIFDVRFDLEQQRAKINSMVDALGILAEGDDAPLFFTLQNALEPVDTELERIIERMATLEPRDQPASTADAYSADFYRRTFEEWSAAVAENDGNSLDTDEDRLYGLMLKNHTATAGDAALKMRVVVHSLFVSDARSQFPDQCAALSDVVADLERMDAAAEYARRSAGKAVRS
jgi:hypothetical protein